AQPNAAMTKDSAIPGPAKFAAAVPVSEKIPAPMIAPIPRATNWPAPSVFFSDSFSASARMAFSGFVTKRLMEFDFYKACQQAPLLSRLERIVLIEKGAPEARQLWSALVHFRTKESVVYHSNVKRPKGTDRIYLNNGPRAVPREMNHRLPN